jgi:uncharacterized membrane protein (UPF0127 family)
MDVVSKKDVFKVKLCRNFFSKLRGWMFRLFFDYDGLLFDLNGTKSYSLHMLFVFNKLDIIYIDSNFTILKVLKNAKPFIPFIPAVKCNYILEVLDSRHLKKGDRVIFMYD